MVKGERSEVREQSPLKEPPLSTGLYLAPRDTAFPISTHITLSCHVVNGTHVNHKERNEWKWNDDDGNELQYVHTVDTVSSHLSYTAPLTLHRILF